ncbi:iron ABC transporter permease [Leisingera aquaemixtae]|uniref:lipocalin-like domain-containing protein n=1 Tax=Leisingera aquaemixtae TaxID=1396826 RepID=UPI0021A486CE|nr:lipocalin-like domain-containing protein [Leisingera aquaemixtae]UWQ39007.1 iron ABC transporter permease [Leisingera aquaemixtae]
MNVRPVLALVITAWASSALPQGFAGLGSDAEGFAMPQRGQRLSFPQDHGPHPDFRIEWWYLTANLEAADGRDYGIQWTLFRSALAPGEGDGWQSPQVWMAHAAVTASDQHLFAERIARGGIGQAGVTSQPFMAWIDNWQMASAQDNLENLTLTAAGENFSYDLLLSADGPLVLHGEDGYSVKSAGGQASYYYSQPHYQVSGTVTLPGGAVEVTGHGWLDREWSSQPLAEDQSGWDWFSLSFESGAKLMGFVLRAESGDFTSGTWISADGTAEPLEPGAFQADPLDYTMVEGRSIPTRWRAALPGKGVSVEVEALNPQSWMGTSFPYWEGPVTVTGSHSGTGYLEMTGYE